MKTIGNVIWFVFGGLFWALTTFLGGVIPFGKQYFKMATFVISPLGYTFK